MVMSGLMGSSANSSPVRAISFAMVMTSDAPSGISIGTFALVKPAVGWPNVRALLRPLKLSTVASAELAVSLLVKMATGLLVNLPFDAAVVFVPPPVTEEPSIFTSVVV